MPGWKNPAWDNLPKWQGPRKRFPETQLFLREMISGPQTTLGLTQQLITCVPLAILLRKARCARIVEVTTEP